MKRALLVVTLLLLLPGMAGAAALKLSTWNLEWLTARPQGDRALPRDVRPKDAEAMALLRRYAEILDADVAALQEVDGPAMAARLFPPERYALHFTADDVVQRTGFAVRRGLRFTANPDLVGLTLGPRSRLRSGADITLMLPGGSRLRLLSVHLKTGCREDRMDQSRRDQCATLRLQLPVLQGWIAQRRAEGVPFVLMGDFNRWMDGRDDFFAALQEGGPLARATEGHYSTCWGGGGFIDHIIAGGSARGWMQPETLRVLVFRERGGAWKQRLSDHCPVSVRFEVP
jgi:endonuclease/exonuclease/phosphatase family metal-dependent hydrolase